MNAPSIEKFLCAALAGSIAGLASIIFTQPLLSAAFLSVANSLLWWIVLCLMSERRELNDLNGDKPCTKK